MKSKGVSLPLIHEHLLMPWNDLRRGDCCGFFESNSGGFLCKICDLYFHKKCIKSSESIEHPSHPAHTLKLESKQGHLCDLCRRPIVNLCYRCEICDFDVDLHCAKYPPPDVIDIPQKHHHKLTLLRREIEFQCSAECGEIGHEFPYKCHECDVAFHAECVWHPPEVKHKLEVKHSYHSLHPLKLFRGQKPDYSDGKCHLCGREIDEVYYHCSSCNFTLDMCCVLNPPPKSLFDSKVHNHQLSLLPRLISFACNACGLKGDRSPYMCVQCNFVIHEECFTLPRLININRHDHRVSRIPLLGVVNSVCRICHKKMDWSCGGYSCQKCIGYVVHSKCATSNDVWNGKELEGVPEKIEDTKPYVTIDHNTIHHFSHKEHYLRLNINGLPCEDKKRCNACTQPISLQIFYGCVDCDFLLHQNCAEFPRSKRHVLHNERLTLATCKDDFFLCDACGKASNGFMYKHGDKKLDVFCGSISEPFVHPSHPHPLYYIPAEKVEICNGCNLEESHVLRCIEDGCRFFLGINCATLPQMVKHRVDDHPLSLCYGEKASGKYWCDICEKETNPENWFYTCKDDSASLHIKCVLGSFARLMPGSTIKVWYRSYKVVLNNSISRPFCGWCKSHCMYPIILKMLGTSEAHFCSLSCTYDFKNSISK